MNATLNIGQKIDGYSVEEFVKTSADGSTESYLVSDNEGKRGLMKLYTFNTSLRSIEFNAKNVFANSSSLIPMTADGSIQLNGTDYRYCVREFIDGKRLSDLIEAGKRYTWKEAQPIILQVIMALRHLHSQEPAIIHNDITARNILIKEDDDNVQVYIIGMGHLSHRCNGKAIFCTKDLNNWYRAPETFKGIYDEQSDIFSVGALLHTMLLGFEPWGVASDALGPNVDKNQLKHIRSVGDEIIDDMDLTDEQKMILSKMITLDYDKRYRCVKDVIKDLLKGSVIENIKNDIVRAPQDQSYKMPREIEEKLSDETVEKTIEHNMATVHKGRGFADVAGMADVKHMLYKDVMFVMQNKEKAERYRLKAPNGALFYGPPGCGKTFIAEMRKARRSVTPDDASDYERMRKKFEQQTPRQERRRIGF